MSLQQFSNEDKQRIQNIQLLRIINTLDDEITVREYKNTSVTSEQSDYYELGNQSKLNMWYKRISDNLKNIVNTTKEYTDEKQEIKDIISEGIEKYKNNLAQVKDCIEERFHMLLSSIDNAYIERKYIKYCARLWLQETINFLKEQTESKSRTNIQEIFNSLVGIVNLCQIPNPLNKLKYYTLLMEHYNLVRREDEKIFISRFKKECFEEIVAYSNSVEKELVFLETFVDFLSSSKNLQSIIAELGLDNFCCGDLSYNELINNIMKLEVDTYGENLTVLQEVTEDCKEEEDLFLIDKFKEVLGAYIKPVEIQESNIDGRFVIEITGKNVVVSEILPELENRLSEKSNIEEVRFVGADIIHIDTNLESEVWQGRNIVILTKAIKVYDQVIWNVSGKNNDHIYSGNAGTGEDGHGKRGNDGYPGESGGNVLVLTEKIENPENFTIMSHGGKGSKGQDGGNGKVGEDGKGITEAEFKEKFPPAAKFTHVGRALSILQTVNSIKENLKVIKTEWYESPRGFLFKTDATFDKNVIKEVIDDSEKTKYYHNSRSECPFKGNIFINAMTNQGNEIIFSFERGGNFTNCQAFLLYKGSLGQPGGHGGEYGLGGQGGYTGEITVKNLENDQEFNIIKEFNQGKEGEKGQGGLYGHGKNGWDMGYMDYSVSGFFADKWPKFYGTNQNSKLSLEFYQENNSSRIQCPHRERKGAKDIFVEVKAPKIEHEKQKRYEERKNIRQNSDRQHHAQAVRKKNISQSGILANYSHHCSSMGRSTLRNLQSNLERTKQLALQAIIENQEQNQTIELRIKRQVMSTYQAKSKHYNDIIATTPNTTYRDTIDVRNLIGKLKKIPSLLLRNWSQLKNIELRLSQLNQLFSVLETLQNSSLETSSPQNNTELQNIKKLLSDKYRIATLQKIAKHLPLYQEVADSIELIPENAPRYLIEVNENDNNISHHTLGTLNQYLYENGKTQREQISEFCKDELQNKDNQTLKSSIREYILEVGNSQEVHEDVQKYYEKYLYFLKMQQHGFIVFPESLNKLNDDCCTDESILTEYVKYLEEKGATSISYQELLAFVFDTNIRLYVEDQYNRLSVQHNHNPSSTQAIHVLYRDNKFIQLEVDENYLKLEEERKKKDDLCAKILIEIESFEQKQEFDDYLKHPASLSHSNPLNDKQYFDEEEDIKKIIQYFPEDEKLQLKERLDKVMFQYSGQHGIAHNILKRFSSEGKHVSFQELCYLVNSILSYSLDDRKEENTFCWIIAAYPQSNWINELILLQLENHFKKQLEEKSKWGEYLSKIENQNILLLFGVKLDNSSALSPKCIEDILCILSNIPNETVSLEGLELSEWPYALKEKYWSCKLSKVVDWQNSDLSTASYYLLFIENTFGTDLVEKLLDALQRKKQELSPDMLTNILSNFYNEKWDLSREELETLRDCNIREWEQKMQQKCIADEEEREITKLVKLIKSNANTSEGISDNLSKIADSIQSISEKGKSVNSFTTKDIEKWVKDNKERQHTTKAPEEILAVIDRAIELERGFKLRNTQKLTILALLTNDHNTLAQVSTGEGKSLIVVAASIIKAFCGEKVDIITSSSVLAKRDAEDNTAIYSLFNINVSHNCSEDIEKRKEAYSGNQVVYGDLSNFQRDYLLDKFYGKNILGDHNFENVIVDEVDSMLLDKGNNMLYLSHDLAGFDKLESVYIYIWQWINRPAWNHEEICYAFNTKSIKEAVIHDLYGLVKKEDFAKLGSELSEQQRCIIEERLIKAEILDYQGKLLKESITDNELDQILSSEFSNYKDSLNYLLKECIERKKFIHVPSHLRSFVEQHLENWINSARTAFFMKAGQDYVVDIDRTGSGSDRNPNITILDRDTGTDQANSQWDEALHQFLQLKHGCKLSLQSLKAVFISNVSYFKLYDNLYGLTGTLGSHKERDLLREIHKVDFVTIPTAKSKQFHENKPILCTGKDEWINQIRNEVKNLTEKVKRSVLIICETVNDVQVLQKAFGEKDAQHVHTYIRDFEEFDIGQDDKKLEQGQVIIATNLAGRGTDIKITDTLRTAGGLHVCLTYLPNNIRIEQQAFGRAARSGDKGSGQLIIIDSKEQGYSNSRIFDLKKERDAEELHRISDTKAYYETQITLEESCFKKFREQYELLKKDLDDKKVPTEVKEILLQSCLDKWAFWLDKHNKSMRNLTKEQDKKNLRHLLDKFISQLKNLGTGYSEEGLIVSNIKYDSISWLAWIEENPVQMVKLGRYLSQNQQHKNAYESAIQLFNDVIIKDSYFSEAAHYYKAFALAKKINWEQIGKHKQNLKQFKNELREAARLLDEHSKFATTAAGIISKIKKNNNESVIKIDAYEEQQKSMANFYYMFSRSIDDIFGHAITPQSFVSCDVNEELTESIYKVLFEKGILKKPKVHKNVSEKDLKTISSDYGVSSEISNFLSKYKGKEINEKEFQKVLKKEVQLPNREVFWKSLIKQEVLIEEVKYVVVDKEKLREITSLLNFLTEKVDKKELQKQIIVSNNEQIFLHEERIAQQKSNYVFKKDDFKKVVDKAKYQILQNRGILSFNKQSCIDPSKIKSATFTCYDSIALEDFSKVNITTSEAEKILAELIERNVLEIRDTSENSVYGLKIKFDEIKQVRLSSCSVYENAVKGLLSVCFAYRIALQKIAEQLEEKNFPVRIQLMTKPHQNLVSELLEQRVIKPVTVTNETEGLENTIEEILRNKPELVNEERIKEITKHIVRTLERSRSSLKTLKVPDYKLKPFTELCDQAEFANIDEVHVFFLNGLDQLLQLQEKKWTRKMLLNTAAVIVMGISQIAVGTVIELYSMGFMTHVGAAFINEGISDLFFAVGALKSGYFSWEDYGRYKLESLMITATTVGIGAYLSRGAKISRFGNKLAAPTFEVGAEKVAQMAGTQLIKTAGYKAVGKEVAKRIALKSIEGLAFGLADVGVDAIIENHLQTLCEGIASEILSNIEQKVDEHNISINLKKVYETLGEQETGKMVNSLTQCVLNEQNCVEKFLPAAIKIASNVNQGIAKAVEKRSKTDNKLAFPVHIISKIVVWSDRGSHIANITTITGNFLSNLDKKIEKLQLDNEQNKHAEPSSLNQEQKNKDYEKFKKEMTDKWKLLLQAQAGRVISQHIINPILKEATNRLVRYVGKKVQEAYKSCNENWCLEYFEELKQEYEEMLRDHDNRSTTENNITEKYHKNLLKLMKKKSPKLFAAIVREGIPMDLTCVDACTLILHEMLQEQGVSGLTIIVEGDNGIGQTFSSVPEGTEGITIRLELKDNHFQLCGSNISENNGSGNNCLYDALGEAVPQLKDTMTPQQFRTKVADRIEHDEKIRHHIQQGWHRLPIFLDAFGGAAPRKRSKVVRDESSSSYNEVYQHRERSVSKHLKDRLVRLFRLGGSIQRISELTDVDRAEIVTEGPSQYQDKSSKKGKDVHAAHVIRGMLSDKIPEKHKQSGDELKNFLGHTQNVPRYANEWHGVRGEIDNFQSKNFKNLAKIDFSRSLTEEHASTIKEIRNDFIAALDKQINKGTLSESRRSELKRIKADIININTETLFGKGQKGYFGDVMNPYR